MIVLVDYHKGNIASVARSLESVGADVLVSDDPAIIQRADAVVLPGVGAFADAMETITQLSLDSVLLDAIRSNKPFLGICLGMQLLFASGEEHAQEGCPIAGLGVIEGCVSRMPKESEDGDAFKIPHVGWNTVELTKQSDLFCGIPDGEHFYFTHSFMAPASPYTIATTKHSVRFPVAVQVGNAYGVQFHPEKSSDAGLAVLSNFVKKTK